MLNQKSVSPPWPSERTVTLPRLGSVTRLGLATRGNTMLPRAAVQEAMERGVDFLNWCGHSDGMRDAVRRLGRRRRRVRVAVQLEARDARAARSELSRRLDELETDHLDVVTYYYVEQPEEWEKITSPLGAGTVLEEACIRGVVGAVGVTTHQRPLAALIAASGKVDLIMVRYNAAHRGAEQEVFPVTSKHQLPVVAFTCLRWGTMLKPTPEDPPGFVPPSAADCYRFVLSHPSVSVALMAPNGTSELRENMALLDAWSPLSAAQHRSLIEHGDRVHRLGGAFP